MIDRFLIKAHSYLLIGINLVNARPDIFPTFKKITFSPKLLLKSPFYSPKVGYKYLVPIITGGCPLIYLQFYKKHPRPTASDVFYKTVGISVDTHL